MESKKIGITSFLDEHPFSLFQWRILALCFCAVFVDGFDTAAVGFVAPALVKEWHIGGQALGPVLSAALVGLAIGALVAGPFADRVGRKTILVISVALFGLASLGAATVTSLDHLVIARFLTGLGLGGAMPNATTLCSEYCPAKRRSLLVTTMFCGFTFGSALGGVAAAYIIPVLGWRGVFIIGGVAPLLLCLLLLLLLPESVRFMVARGRPTQKVAKILARIAPGEREEIESASAFVIEDAVARSAHPIKEILTAPIRAGTLLLWSVFFCGLFVIFLLTSWLPLLMNSAGFSMAQSALTTALFQLGGTVGAILVGLLMDIISPHLVLMASYLLGAAFVFFAGSSVADATLLGIGILGAGFFMSGAQTPMNALAAGYYPTQIRATGVSWMLGVGRLGAILGAYIGGPLLAMHWSFQDILHVLCVPALVAAVAIAIKGLVYRERKGKAADAPHTVSP